MTEYSYSDLVKMQDQAIRRVREMQERARLTMKENPIPDLQNPQKDAETTPVPKNDKKEKSVGYQSEKQSETQKVQSECTCTDKEKPHPTSDKPPQKEKKHGAHEKIVTDRKAGALDTDKAIILPLLMLLSREGADEILLIALLYLLA